MPLRQIFCKNAFYSLVLLIWYATRLCLYKKDFGPLGQGPWPRTQGSHQNSKCVLPVLIHRDITCDSFKVLAQKAREELCDKKRTPSPTFWPLHGDVTPVMPPGQIFCTTYSILHYLWFEMQHDYVCTKWILRPFGATPLALPPGDISKFWMCSSSPHP